MFQHFLYTHIYKLHCIQNIKKKKNLNNQSLIYVVYYNICDKRFREYKREEMEEEKLKNLSKKNNSYGKKYESILYRQNTKKILLGVHNILIVDVMRHNNK